jgi:phosphoribosyl 1,2-cyclic phosphodiesterase/DNA-binding response OmpR family regulator
MRIQFWGTRGSIAKPGPSTARYGGNTSCIELRSARGTLVVIDCGTGGHSLAQKLITDDAKPLCGNILISHTHWDHIQGIPFFYPLFVGGSEWDIYGPKGVRESLREVLAGQMQYNYFPVTLDQCGAKIRFHDLVEGAFAIDDIKLSTRYLNHPALTLGYRLQVDGATMVYACDHEPHARMLALGDATIAGQDLRHAEFIDGADLLIHDAQYTAEEYPEKVGWGHSPAEYVVKLAQYARVKRVALTHHDPLRDDDAMEHLIAGVRQHSSPVDVFAAFEGQVVEVAACPGRVASRCEELQAENPVEPARAPRAVLLGVADTGALGAVSVALRAESICTQAFLNIDDGLTAIAKDRPSLAIIDHDPPRTDGIGLCRAIRRQAWDEHALAVVLVAEQQNEDAGVAAGVSDWLIKPFTAAHARTTIRKWLLRTASKSIKGAIPADQEQRLLRVRHTAKSIGSDRSLQRVLQKRADQRDPAVSSDKSALLWMYGREIASFDTPTFSKKLGEIITRATSMPQTSSRSR